MSGPQRENGSSSRIRTRRSTGTTGRPPRFVVCFGFGGFFALEAFEAFPPVVVGRATAVRVAPRLDATRGLPAARAGRADPFRAGALRFAGARVAADFAPGFDAGFTATLAGLLVAFGTRFGATVLVSLAGCARLAGFVGTARDRAGVPGAAAFTLTGALATGRATGREAATVAFARGAGVGTAFGPPRVTFAADRPAAFGVGMVAGTGPGARAADAARGVARGGVDLAAFTRAPHDVGSFAARSSRGPE